PRRPEPRDAGHPRGREPGRRDLGGSLVRLEPGRPPRVRQDGHRAASRTRRPVLVHVLHRRRQAPDRDRGDGRGRWLRSRNGGADRAADGLALVRRKGKVRGRELEDLLMPLAPIQSPIKPAEEPPPSAAPRSLRLPFDPLTTLAALGLAACSLVTLAAATKNLVPGNPHYYVDRQAIYLGVGLAAMAVLSRIDYGSLAKYKNGIYIAL